MNCATTGAALLLELPPVAPSLLLCPCSCHDWANASNPGGGASLDDMVVCSCAIPLLPCAKRSIIASKCTTRLGRRRSWNEGGSLT
jgi:hypothetical protein